MSRELDMEIAEKVFGLRHERIRPQWYPIEVDVFIQPSTGWIIYSYDANGCNAMMHRNGKDEKNGTAFPLPFFSTSIEVAWSVVDACRCGGIKLGQLNLNLTEEDAAKSICESALREIAQIRAMILANCDPELSPWLEAARKRGGGFVRTIAEAAFRADTENYELLRPALLELQKKYPGYVEHPEDAQ